MWLNFNCVNRFERSSPPFTTVTRSSGNVSLIIFASKAPVCGVNSEGLMITRLPAASISQSGPRERSRGKFQAEKSVVPIERGRRRLTDDISNDSFRLIPHFGFALPIHLGVDVPTFDSCPLLNLRHPCQESCQHWLSVPRLRAIGSSKRPFSVVPQHFRAAGLLRRLT
jgi:hypothetical protein